MFYKTAILKNFLIFTGKHLCWGLLFIKVATFRSLTVLKRDFNTDGEYCKIYKNIYFEELEAATRGVL